MEKVCKKCNKSKPITEFYKDKTYTDGYKTRCKSCASRLKKDYRYNPDTRQLRRQQEVENNRRYYERHPVKAKAHRAVMYALKHGKLIKSPCEVCGSLVVQAHHDDYSKPLSVRWLCRQHHMELHTKNNDAGKLQPEVFVWPDTLNSTVECSTLLFGRNHMTCE